MLIVIDIIVKASAILALAALAAAAMRRGSAASRHFIWTLGVLGALGAPLLSTMLPQVQLPIVRVAQAQPPLAPLTPDSTRQAPPLRARAAGPAIDVAPAPERPELPALPSTGTLVFAVWALGAAVILGRMLLGLAAVQVMSRRTRSVADASWLPLARDLESALGLSRVRFLQSSIASMPMAWGILRPSVLMPAAADSWAPEKLRIVLLHELAHVKRRDCLTHLVAQAACALYWFNPLAWMAVRRLRAERERACDDLVLAAGTRGSEYADQLLDIARLMHATRFPAVLAGASLAMAHRSQLEGRLMAILDPSVPRRGMTRARAALVTTAFAVAIIPLASVQPWAEEQPVVAGHDMVLPAADRVTYAVQAAPAPKPVPAQRPAPAPDSVETITGSLAQSIAGVVGGVAGGVVEGVAGGVIQGVADGIAQGISDGVREGIGHGIGRGVGKGIGGGVGIGRQDKPAIAGDKKEARQADPRAVAALIEALKDTDKDVRETAMQALVELRDPRIYDPLVAALKDASADVREKAAFGLGQLRDVRAVDPLMGALRDASPDVREQVVFALGQLRDRRAVEPLISALKDEKPDVREQAAFALGQLRDPRSVEPLVIALKDADGDVREQAAFALGQIRDPRAIDGLTAALKDAQASVRQQAAFALGQIR